MILTFGILLNLSKDWIVFEGGDGPGKAKHVVLLAGDEEYRSEEALPQLARILATRHGFKCTVLFSINAKGEIDPTVRNHQPGLEALRHADVCVMLLRFREWPDEQMKFFAEYLGAGKPIIALRTSTHAFDYSPDSKSRYRQFGWKSAVWPGGFGKQILGENWVSHWGDHGVQATRGIIVKQHSILRGVQDVFGTTDVYEASPPPDSEILMRGQVLSGMKPNDIPATNRKVTAAGTEQGVNNPMMPIVWLRSVRSESGAISKILTTTMGAATDLLNEGLRRLLTNGVYWAGGLEEQIPAKAEVDNVGPYEPSPFGFGKFKRGVKPDDLAR